MLSTNVNIDLVKISYTLCYTYLEYPSDVKTIKIKCYPKFFTNIVICTVKSPSEACVTNQETRNIAF